MKNHNSKGDLLQINYSKKSQKEHQTEKLVCAAWCFTKTAMWPKSNISFTDTELSKDFIRCYFHLHGNHEKAFISFCTRILLAREYFEQFPQRLPQSVDWLNSASDDGFNITLPWYNQLLYRREHAEVCREDLRELVNCYLQYTVNQKEQLNALKKYLGRYGRSPLSALFKEVISH